MILEEGTSKPSSKKVKSIGRDQQQFARRMIKDGIMPVETISRLAGLSVETVRKLAATITTNGD